MPNLTTAQRLSAYHDELLQAGFNAATAGQMTVQAAPRCADDVELQSDLDEPTPKMGPVTVYMLPKVDEESLARTAEEIKWALRGAISDEGAPTDA